MYSTLSCVCYSIVIVMQEAVVLMVFDVSTVYVSRYNKGPKSRSSIHTDKSRRHKEIRCGASMNGQHCYLFMSRGIIAYRYLHWA